MKRMGDQWLIPLCGSRDEPQMTVQAAINGNDIRFANGNPTQPPSFLGSAWTARGVPITWPDALTLSPERAARFAYETFGVRVTEVPQIFVRGDVISGGGYALQPGSARFCNRARVTLESDVTIRGQTSLESTTTNTIYVGALTCHHLDVEPYVHRPLADQPASATLQYVDNNVSPAKTWVITIPFASPVRFEIGSRGS